MNKLPYEVVDIIIDYKLSMIHKDKFKNVLKDIPLSSTLKKINYINKIYEDRVYLDDYLDIILDKTTKDERFFMMSILNTCKCCDRHQSKKPSLKQYLDGYVPDYSTTPYRKNKCKCYCRAFARSLCRAQNDEILD